MGHKHLNSTAVLVDVQVSIPYFPYCAIKQTNTPPPPDFATLVTFSHNLLLTGQSASVMLLECMDPWVLREQPAPLLLGGQLSCGCA